MKYIILTDAEKSQYLIKLEIHWTSADKYKTSYEFEQERIDT